MLLLGVSLQAGGQRASADEPGISWVCWPLAMQVAVPHPHVHKHVQAAHVQWFTRLALENGPQTRLLSGRASQPVPGQQGRPSTAHTVAANDAATLHLPATHAAHQQPLLTPDHMPLTCAGWRCG